MVLQVERGLSRINGGEGGKCLHSRKEEKGETAYGRKIPKSKAAFGTGVFTCKNPLAASHIMIILGRQKYEGSPWHKGKNTSLALSTAANDRTGPK